MQKWAMTQGWALEGHLSAEFVSKYEDEYSPNEHIKICIDQDRLTTLWKKGNSTHCHYEKNGIVESIFTGYDGDLYCCSYELCQLWGGIVPLVLLFV